MFVFATPGEIIYFINRRPEPEAAYRELTAAQKRKVVKACETNEESDAEHIVDEAAGTEATF